jgi:hypothetical protein
MGALGDGKVMRDEHDGDAFADEEPSSSSTRSTFFTSRLPVGSSAKMMDGVPTIARAMATRWRSPPESWPGRCPRRCDIPTRPRAACAAARLAAGSVPSR